MRKTMKLLHQWLGLVSGLVVAIVAITGCFFAFADEIQTAGMNHIEHANTRPLLSPDSLATLVQHQLEASDDTIKIACVTYRKAGLTARVAWIDKQGTYRTAMVNPYTGEIVGQLRGESFFRWILKGHRGLWLPRPIGSYVVGWSTVVFVLVLLSGLVMWMPQRWTRRTLNDRLKVKWKAKMGRRLFDLHNTLGFYVALIALILALTGLTWSFKPVRNAYYSMLTDKQMVEWSQPTSDTTQVTNQEEVGQQLWQRFQQLIPQEGEGDLRFDFPQGKYDVYRVSYNPDNHRYYRQRYWFFDRYSGKPLEGGGSYAIQPSEMSHGYKFFRMTYDIHSGSVGGIWGRIIVFLVSLIVASLPITGYILWWRKRNT